MPFEYITILPVKKRIRRPLHPYIDDPGRIGSNFTQFLTIQDLLHQIELLLDPGKIIIPFRTGFNRNTRTKQHIQIYTSHIRLIVPVENPVIDLFEGKKISTRIPYYLFKEKRYPTGQLIRQLRTVKSSITDQDSRHRL